MYNSKEFKTAWAEWKKHKQEKFGLPYTPTSEEKALSVLFKKSHGIEDLAIQSIDLSIESNWSNIYIKKDYTANGQQYTENGQPSGLRAGVQEELNKRYGNG